MSYTSFLTAQKLAAVAYPTGPPGRGHVAARDRPDRVVLDGPHGATPVDLPLVPGGSDVYVILLLQFGSPVTIATVAIQREGGSTGTGRRVTGSYNGNPITCGYVYFYRTDGAQFENGPYTLVVEATAGGDRVTYNGTFTIGSSSPTTPAQEPISANTVIMDTVGQQATIGHD